MASKRYDLKVQMVRWVPATLKFTVGELWNRIPARFTNNLINIRHRLLHDLSAIFVLPSYFFAMDNYYPVTLQAHGAWYHVQIPCPHQRNDTSRPVFICYVVTEIQGTSVYERESWRPEPILSSTLTRQHAWFASFIYYRQLCARPEGSLSKDHFTIDQSDCMICNTALWFVNRRAILLKSDLEMNQHQWTWTCASCRGRAYMAPLTLPLANQIAPFATLWFVSLRAEVSLQNH